MGVLGLEVGWGGGLALAVLSTWSAAAYCYWFVRKLPPGLPRVLASAPVFVLYAGLPLIFSRETHLVGLACFYCIITWLGSFKVLLLCWGTGPGCDPWVASCFPRFAVVMSFPAHMRRAGRVVKRSPERGSWLGRVAESEAWPMLVLRSGLKLAALAFLVLKVLPLRDALPRPAIYLLYSVQLYLFVTIVLETLAAVAAAGFAITIEPHFDNPFAAASLEEFWARRWNLLVSNSLRETVYNPVLHLLRAATPPADGAGHEAPIAAANPQAQRARTRRPKSSPDEAPKSEEKLPATLPRYDVPKFVAMLAAFFVSGLAHELAVYYMTLVVTGEMTAFFTLQGVAVGMEAAWRIYFPGTRPPKLVARCFTLAFVFVTASRLFWPPLARGADLQVIAEMQRMLTFF